MAIKAIDKECFIFENHFIILFWRRHKWFGANNYPNIIQTLHDLGYDVI